jgi:hypothetical protein
MEIANATILYNFVYGSSIPDTNAPQENRGGYMLNRYRNSAASLKENPHHFHCFLFVYQ